MNKTSLVEEKYLKKVPELRPGDIVRVHQKIKEGTKERIQIFEGVVLKVKGGGLKATFLVRKVSFGVGVEKNFLLHSPNIAKIEVKKRSKVRQAYLTHLRKLQGKSARLKDKQFDILAVNVKEEIPEVIVEEKDVEVHLSEVEKAEEKEANIEDAKDKDEGDEQEAEIEEIEEGVEKAEEEEGKGKDTEGETAEKSEEEKPEKEIAEEIKEEKE